MQSRGVAVLITSACAYAAAQTPGVHFPGIAPGTDHGWVTALSHDGSVAAGFSSVDLGNSRAPGFTWTLAGGRQDFDVIPGVMNQSPALAISSDGEVVVGWMSGGNILRRAYRRIGNGAFEPLGTLTYENSLARGISGDGDIIVGQAETFDKWFGILIGEAFRWTPSGGMQGLGWLWSLDHSEARAVSRDGSTIVGNDLAAPFVWRHSTGMAPLPGHPGAPAPEGYPHALNADGSIIVGAARTASSQMRATRWTANGIEELGTIHNRARTTAYAVNDDGDIIGGVAFGEPDVAFVWTPATGMIELRDHLEASGIGIPPGWRLEAVRAISGDGRTFAGEAVHTTAGRQGFIATIPAACYANCDGSTRVPALDVNDFHCFLAAFAAAQSLTHQEQIAHYANCDASTIAPALNVDDFTCFINTFAQSCP